MEGWGKMDPKNGNMRPALIVSSFHNDPYMEIANVVYVGPDEILYPVPRSLYTLDPEQCQYMSKSCRAKMTTILSEDSVISVQIDPNTSKVNCMSKGGSGGFALLKRGMLNWVMDVDVAVSDEQHRRIFVSSAELPGALVKSQIEMKSFEPNKPYKGVVKLNIFHETLAEYASRDISHFLYWQKLFKEADRPFFEFSLMSICETDEPNIAVVYDAPWQAVKRSIVLTPAQVGDVSEDEWSSLPPPEPKKESAMEKFIGDQQQQWEDVGTSTSVVSDSNESTIKQKEDSVGIRPIYQCLGPITEILSPASIKEIWEVINSHKA